MFDLRNFCSENSSGETDTAISEAFGSSLRDDGRPHSGRLLRPKAEESGIMVQDIRENVVSADSGYPVDEIAPTSWK